MIITGIMAGAIIPYIIFYSLAKAFLLSFGVIVFIAIIVTIELATQMYESHKVSERRFIYVISIILFIIAIVATTEMFDQLALNL